MSPGAKKVIRRRRWGNASDTKKQEVFIPEGGIKYTMERKSNQFSQMLMREEGNKFQITICRQVER